jgi:hypothetical protein
VYRLRNWKSGQGPKGYSLRGRKNAYKDVKMPRILPVASLGARF